MSSTTAEPQVRGRRFGDAQILGMVLLAGGALWLLDVANVVAMSIVTVLAILLIILGAGMMLSGGRLQAGVIVAGIILVCALVGASFFTTAMSVSDSGPVRLSDFSRRGVDGAVVGDVTLTPPSIEEMQSEYSFGVGDVTLDLSEIDFPEGETPLTVRMGVGHLALILPSNVGVRGHAEIGAGEVRLFGRRLTAGTGGSASFNERAQIDPGREILLEIKGGLGEIEVFYGGL